MLFASILPHFPSLSYLQLRNVSESSVLCLYHKKYCVQSNKISLTKIACDITNVVQSVETSINE